MFSKIFKWILEEEIDKIKHSRNFFDIMRWTQYYNIYTGDYNQPINEYLNDNNNYYYYNEIWNLSDEYIDFYSYWKVVKLLLHRHGYFFAKTKNKKAAYFIKNFVLSEFAKLQLASTIKDLILQMQLFEEFDELFIKKFGIELLNTIKFKSIENMKAENMKEKQRLEKLAAINKDAKIKDNQSYDKVNLNKKITFLEKQRGKKYDDDYSIESNNIVQVNSYKTLRDNYFFNNETPSQRDDQRADSVEEVKIDESFKFIKNNSGFNSNKVIANSKKKKKKKV